MPADETTSLPGASAPYSLSRERDRRLGRWTLVVGVGLFVVLLVVKASLLEAAYPALTLAAGVLLYRHYPALYVGYTWWIVFLTPEVRRMVDYQSGWSELSPIMLAPMLVAGLPVFGLVRPTGFFWGDRKLLPFWLALGGVALGYAVGLWRSGVFAATYGVLVWAVPIVFGMYVVQVGWARFARLRRILEHTFLWGVLIMGVYGIVQYFFVPPWDGFWMIQSGMGSIGTPEPQQLRVFSTLNSPGPFASVLMAGLLVLFAVKSWLRVPAAAAGYTAFLLTLVRAAWLGWIIGALLLVAKARQRQRRRLVIGLLVTGGVIIALAYFSPLQDTIGDRINSLGRLGQDDSMQARLAFMNEMKGTVFADPVGKGIGSAGGSAKLSTGEAKVFDSGLLRVPFALGWGGALLYAVGVGWLLLRGWQASWQASSQSAMTFTVAAYGIAVALAAQMLSGHTLAGESGLAFWTFVAAAVVAQPGGTGACPYGRAHEIPATYTPATSDEVGCRQD